MIGNYVSVNTKVHHCPMLLGWFHYWGTCVVLQRGVLFSLAPLHGLRTFRCATNCMREQVKLSAGHSCWSDLRRPFENHLGLKLRLFAQEDLARCSAGSEGMTLINNVLRFPLRESPGSCPHSRLSTSKKSSPVAQAALGLPPAAPRRRVATPRQGPRGDWRCRRKRPAAAVAAPAAMPNGAETLRMVPKSILQHQETLEPMTPL